jgi:hypothetical protein
MVVTMQAVIPRALLIALIAIVLFGRHQTDCITYALWIALIANIASAVFAIVDMIQRGKFNQHYSNDLWQRGNRLICWRDGNKWMRWGWRRWRVAVMSIFLGLQLLLFILILGRIRLCS